MRWPRAIKAAPLSASEARKRFKELLWDHMRLSGGGVIDFDLLPDAQERDEKGRRGNEAQADSDGERPVWRLSPLELAARFLDPRSVRSRSHRRVAPLRGSLNSPPENRSDQSFTIVGLARSLNVSEVRVRSWLNMDSEAIPDRIEPILELFFGKLPELRSYRNRLLEVWKQAAEQTFREVMATIPEQAMAPVRVEERNGKVSRIRDSDSPLGAAERDFDEWRMPVWAHLQEMLVSDFPVGTNHGRTRDRLVALSKLFDGTVTEIKERQFRIGYEVERFHGLVLAYRSGGDDMPALNASVLEDLDRLRIALMMGALKLERWAEFKRVAATTTILDNNTNIVAITEGLNEMAVEMEKRPAYFDPELPQSLRFLMEALRNPGSAAKTVVYGAVKSAENVMSFLGRKSLGIGVNAVDGLERHISKAIAVTLITALSGAALRISGALPTAWAWLQPLLDALAKAHGG
jgi:hypothetical protein